MLCFTNQLLQIHRNNIVLKKRAFANYEYHICDPCLEYVCDIQFSNKIAEVFIVQEARYPFVLIIIIIMMLLRRKTKR